MQRDGLSGVEISRSEKAYISQGVELGIRGDGRGRLDYRGIMVDADGLAQANGSSRISVAHGATDVLAAIKVEVGTPSPSAPAEGRIEVSVECSNSLFPRFDERASGDLDALLSQLLGGVIAESRALRLGELCIVPGKWCWVVYVDVLILQANGGLLDAASFAAYVALNTARVPRVTLVTGESGLGDDFELSGDVADAAPIAGAKNAPICISLSKVGGF
ncbi:unnamed protein product [Phaeothamnion confervicola]